MKHKLFKLNALLLLGLGLSGLQAQNMYVKEKSGTQTAYLLSNIRKMSFSSGNITVSKTTGSTDTYALNEVRYLNFKDLNSGIQVVEKSNVALLLYPNPVVDVLNIQLSATASQADMIEILSIDGKVVYKQALKSPANIYQVNVSEFPKGLYLCRVKNGTTPQTTKFSKL